MDKINEYIKSNWMNTVHKPEDLRGDIKIKRPFMSPCIAEVYVDMYYWDTYFINKGLIVDGFDELAENNIDNIATFINEKGYMPNANVIPDRTQPPFFTKMVYEYYLYKNDKKIIENYIDTIIKEYNFWMRERVTPVGLNWYAHSGNEEDIRINYVAHHSRIQEESDDPKEQRLIGEQIMAVAESGLDFNLRFRTPRHNLDSYCFIHLDLCCILYDVEIMIGKMLDILGRSAEGDKYRALAKDRKDKINELLYDKEQGVYLDYNFVDKKFSDVLSAASLYPYAFGVSDDKESAKRTLDRLQLKYGLGACEYRGENDIYFQWDYPCMWPAATTLAYMGCKNIGLRDEAIKIAKEYNNVVRVNFEKTGRIWEKYDASNCEIAVTSEYATMPMIGWSAAAYQFFTKELEDYGEL